jgi:excisionase family DNA binding protein
VTALVTVPGTIADTGTILLYERRITPMSFQTPAHDIYNVEEAAIVLHASPLTIREIIKRGELKASLVGRQYLITRAAIDAFVEGRAGIRKEKNVNPITYEKRGNRAVRVA